MLVFSSCEKGNYIVELQGDYEFILYEEIDINELDGVITHLEENIPRILYDFSLESIGEPIKIHVWKTESEFLRYQKKNTGKKYPGSTGYVIKKEAVGVRLTGSVHETIEHELAHVLSNKINRDFSNNPRWLWETVATYESEQFVSPKTHRTYSQGYFPSLDYLNRSFNNGGRKIYDLGYIIGDYIMTEFGRESYKNLIISNGDIEESLGMPQSEFELGWKEFARNKYL